MYVWICKFQNFTHEQHKKATSEKYIQEYIKNKTEKTITLILKSLLFRKMH